MTTTTFLTTTTTTTSSAIMDCVAVVVTLVVIVGVVVFMDALVVVVLMVVVVVVSVAVEAIDANVFTATSAPKHHLAMWELPSMDPQILLWLIEAKMGTADVHLSLHHPLG